MKRHLIDHCIIDSFIFSNIATQTRLNQAFMNTCTGTPGESNFRYKLPKYVTKLSLTKAVDYLKPSYEFFGRNSGLSCADNITVALNHILPGLHLNICTHFGR